LRAAIAEGEGVRHKLARGLRSALLSRQLDRELAEGRSPFADRRLYERAGELTTPAHRAGLALALRRLLERDAEPGIRLAPANWNGIRGCRPLLAHLATRLTEDARPRVRGLALAELLLGDDSGPLYEPAPGDELASAVRRVLAAL
jgi:hypothetical protein